MSKMIQPRLRASSTTNNVPYLPIRLPPVGAAASSSSLDESCTCPASRASHTHPTYKLSAAVCNRAYTLSRLSARPDSSCFLFLFVLPWA